MKPVRLVGRVSTLIADNPTLDISTLNQTPGSEAASGRSSDGYGLDLLDAFKTRFAVMCCGWETLLPSFTPEKSSFLA